MGAFKNLNFGVRGWLLLIYQFLAFVAFTIFTNYPMNMLADLYSGGVDGLLPKIYTAGAVVAIIFQLILAQFIGKISIKKFSTILGVLALVFSLIISVMDPFHCNLKVWQACYFIVCFLVPMWATFSVSTLVGQWFPTKKGAFMGIATLAFPIVNGLMGVFAGLVFHSEMPNPKAGFMPFWIICLIGFIIGVVFIKDFPEQCGAYRDNNKDMTPEIANAMLQADIENKKKSVWKVAGNLTSKDFWCITIPAGLLLMFSVGTMTQTSAIIGAYGDQMAKFGGFEGIMVLIMIFGIIGSLVIGFLDQGLGTKKAMIIASVVMLVSGICGAMGNSTGTVAALVMLAIFMGASSNFTVSAAAQYWRREDFTSVFSTLNPIANLLSAIGPTIIAIALYQMGGPTAVFKVIAVAGVIAIVLMLLFSAKNVKKVDDKRREKAGLALDDALVGRK